MEKYVDGIKYESISMRHDIIGWKLISNWSNGKSAIHIPDNIDGIPIIAIEKGAFTLHSKLQHIEIPDSVEIVHNEAFRRCRLLETVKFYECTLPSKREVISFYAHVFEGCHKLKFVSCEKPCHLNGIGVFSDCFELCQIGNDNKIFGSVYANCFRNCIQLKNLHIVGHHSKLWTNGFYGCTNLNTIRVDCIAVQAPKSILNLLSKKRIICSSKCNLTELAYCGANIEIVS